MSGPASISCLFVILRADSLRYGSKYILKSYLKDPRFRVNVWLRIGQYLYINSENYFIRRVLLRMIKNHLQVKYGFDTTFTVRIGEGFKIVHLGSVVIHGNAIIGKNFTVLNDVNIGQSDSDPQKVPRIGDGCYVGAGAKLIGGIEIGDDVMIGALTLVNKSFKSHSKVVGIPGRCLSVEKD